MILFVPFTTLLAVIIPNLVVLRSPVEVAKPIPKNVPSKCSRPTDFAMLSSLS